MMRRSDVLFTGIPDALPILVKLASVRSEMPLADAVVCAREAGRKYIKVASQELSGEGSA